MSDTLPEETGKIRAPRRVFKVEDAYSMVADRLDGALDDGGLEANAAVLPLVGFGPGEALPTDDAGSFVIRVNPNEGGKATRFAVRIQRISD